MYAVSKTALLGLTKALATEMAPRGIRVNGVAPGIVPTKFASALVEDPVMVSESACCLSPGLTVYVSALTTTMAC